MEATSVQVPDASYPDHLRASTELDAKGQAVDGWSS